MIGSIFVTLVVLEMTLQNPPIQIFVSPNRYRKQIDRYFSDPDFFAGISGRYLTQIGPHPRQICPPRCYSYRCAYLDCVGRTVRDHAGMNRGAVDLAVGEKLFDLID
jgi:hypothetical protein